jgi:hypothetical protein
VTCAFLDYPVSGKRKEYAESDDENSVDYVDIDDEPEDEESYREYFCPL